MVGAAYLAHGSALRGTLTVRLRDPALADDLVHEAFLRLHVEVTGGRAPVNTGAWLHRVASNLVASRWRHARVEARERRRWRGQSEVRSAEEIVERRETARDLLDALAGLRPAEREVILLAAAGLSGPEVAARIGRSSAATRTLLCRARRRIRSVLGGRGVETAIDSGPLGTAARSIQGATRVSRSELDASSSVRRPVRPR